MQSNFEIIEITSSNVDKTGFFCYMSKRKEPGYKQKREWLEARFAEGMKIKVLHEHGGRDTAFIEYIPGEYAWRAVKAPGYLVIHCLWVVGKGKGKGYGTRLIQECIRDAQAQGRRGVAMLASDSPWLADKRLFLKNGFEEVGQAPPTFQLLAQRFGEARPPSLPKDWGKRLAAFGPGLSVVRTSQCPYNESATKLLLESAAAHGMPARVVELTSAREVQESAPCAYGTFGIVCEGKLLSYVYLTREDFEKRLEEISGDADTQTR